ncbi:MAG: hypothetical protein PGN09_13040 [Sphingomonas fennica]
MEDNDVASLVLYGGIFKQIATIAVAAMCILLGYRLFYLTEEKSGQFEMETGWGKAKLSKVAPGVFFTLFGCVTLVVSLTRMNSYEAVRSPNVEKIKVGVRGPSGVTKVTARGAAAKLSLPFDAKSCANGAAYAAGALRAEAGQLNASDQRASFLASKADALELVLSYCIDSELGAGSYKRYKAVTLLISQGGEDALSPEQRKLAAEVERLITGEPRPN